MTVTNEAASGGLITGFQAQLFLWLWCGIVLLYALIRSFSRPDPDPVRDSGPVD